MQKDLEKLITNLEYDVLNGSVENIEINKLCYDSRIVEQGDIFVCLRGARFDSHNKIREVIEKGARAVVVDEDFVLANKNDEEIFGKNESCTIISVDNTRKALAILSANYFENPADKLKIIGITGTKGKTTTTFMIRSILMKAGHKVGMVGTIGIFYGDKHILTDNTTPESFTIHEHFRKMLDEGIEYVVMEVSSLSLKHYRVYGINFYFAVWTNIVSEHIGTDEHSDYNDYLNSKLIIFGQCENVLVNADTKEYDKILNAIDGAQRNIKLYEKKENRHFDLKIPGDYNEENASLAYELGRAMGIDDSTIKEALSETVVPGRIETVYKNDDYTVIVDFSYEDNGARRFLNTIRELKPKRIVTVYGCGGNRSRDRRFGMGEVTGTMADFVILTADNSRFEKTRDIISDIETTLTKHKKLNDLENGYIIIEDRREAIEYAIKNHKKGDVICVMGKGHEPLMEMNGEKVRFLDKEVILEIINNG